MYALVVQTFLMSRYSTVLFWLALTTTTFSLAEMLVLQLTADSVDEHMGSVFRVWREQRRRRQLVGD